jgi:hypothetical protein
MVAHREPATCSRGHSFETLCLLDHQAPARAVLHCRLHLRSLMSTLLIIGIGVLVWLLVCLVVVALCVAARRGDDALAVPMTEASSCATATRRARRRLRQRDRAERGRARSSG